MTPLTKQSLEELKKAALASGPDKELITKLRLKYVSDAESCCDQCLESAKNGASTIAFTHGLYKYHREQSPVILDLIARVKGMQDALEFFYFADDCGVSFYNEETGDVNIENGRIIANDALESFGVK